MTWLLNCFFKVLVYILCHPLLSYLQNNLEGKMWHYQLNIMTLCNSIVSLKNFSSMFWATEQIYNDVNNEATQGQTIESFMVMTKHWKKHVVYSRSISGHSMFKNTTESLLRSSVSKKLLYFVLSPTLLLNPTSVHFTRCG